MKKVQRHGQFMLFMLKIAIGVFQRELEIFVMQLFSMIPAILFSSCSRISTLSHYQVGDSCADRLSNMNFNGFPINGHSVGHWQIGQAVPCLTLIMLQLYL